MRLLLQLLCVPHFLTSIVVWDRFRILSFSFSGSSRGLGVLLTVCLRKYENLLGSTFYPLHTSLSRFVCLWIGVLMALAVYGQMFDKW